MDEKNNRAKTHKQYKRINRYISVKFSLVQGHCFILLNSNIELHTINSDTQHLPLSLSSKSGEGESCAGSTHETDDRATAFY